MSGESLELTEEVPLTGPGESELQSLVCGWWKEARSWLHRQCEAQWQEQTVIRREDDVDGGRASVTKDEERVLRKGWTVVRSKSIILMKTYAKYRHCKYRLVDSQHQKWNNIDRKNAYFVEETISKTQHLSKCIQPRVKDGKERCNSNTV